MTRPNVIEYRTLQIPIPEGKAALIFPEHISKSTAEMLIDIVTAQLNRMAMAEDAQPESAGWEGAPAGLATLQ